MKQIIPAQDIEQNDVTFPLMGERCKNYSIILMMQLYGCSLAQVVQETGLTANEVNQICDSQDYMFLKQTLINNIRKLDQKTLTGKILREANDAFDRMTELSMNAKKEDVRLEANKDILDRAMLTGSIDNSDELRITFVKRR